MAMEGKGSCKDRTSAQISASCSSRELTRWRRSCQSAWAEARREGRKGEEEENATRRTSPVPRRLEAALLEGSGALLQLEY